MKYPLNIFGLTVAELVDVLKTRYGKGRYHAAALYREVFKKGCTSFVKAPEFAKAPSLALALAEDIHRPKCQIVAQQDDDGVVKFISALADGRLIESVIIPSHKRRTLCVSSQVGCQMACRFCATGKMGFVRNLQAEEIVWQVFAARFELNQPIDNIVFMGMGEPLDNFKQVEQAIRIMADQRGLDIAYRHITISTAGHADGICRLGKLKLANLRLAVSLNAADEALRSHLMPINRKYPLGRLKEELHKYIRRKKGVILIEYVLLAGVNDSADNAKKLAGYLQGLPVRINVIAYNGDHATTYQTPTSRHIHRFCQWLREENLFACVRLSKGRGITAACGQLGARPKAGMRLDVV
jgi:23S rRNA (adenine2503-C2)-methyltransferase